jgi:hypothetical protein
MRSFHTLPPLTVISAVIPVPIAGSATDEPHDSQHPAATPGAMMARPDDKAACQLVLEQRMDMMETMMGRMQSAPTTT